MTGMKNGLMQWYWKAMELIGNGTYASKIIEQIN